jgi:hypothetical protein
MGPLSFLLGIAESQDPLHPVPWDVSAGPEKSSDPLEVDEGERIKPYSKRVHRQQTLARDNDHAAGF